MASFGVTQILPYVSGLISNEFFRELMGAFNS